MRTMKAEIGFRLYSRARNEGEMKITVVGITGKENQAETHDAIRRTMNCLPSRFDINGSIYVLPRMVAGKV